MKGSRRPPLRVCPLQMVLPRRPYPLRSPSPRHDLHLRLHRALPHRRDRLLRARAAPIANGIASRPASRAPRRPPDQKENTREEEPSRQRSRHRMAHHRDPGACDAGGDCRVRVCLLCVLPREPVTCTCTCTCTCVCLGMCLNMFLDNLPALRYFRYPQKASPPPPRPGFCFFVQASASPFLNVSQRWLLDHPRCLWPRRSLLTQTRYTQFSVSHAPMRPA